MLAQEPHIMIGTPCYGGMIFEPYLRGLTSVVAEIAGSGGSINLATVVNESLITRARNELVKHFLTSDCTHLFFIDADISFTAEDVFRLVAHDKDVAVASYPLKGIRWENLEGTKDIKDVADIKRRVTEYVVNFEFESEESMRTGTVPVVEGLVQVKDAGTGFMCIKRHVIEKIIEANPQIRYEREQKFLVNEKDDGVRWAVFDTEIEDGWRYLSEDYLFCRRWQRLGGKIWLDPEIILTHVGTYPFQGNKFFDYQEPQHQPAQEVIRPDEVMTPTRRFIGG